MKKMILSVTVFSAATMLTGCNLPGISGPTVKVSQCWSDDTNQTISQIIEPNLKTSLQTALGLLGATDAQTKGLTVSLKMSYQHPTKADPEIGAVQCSASADATISTPAHPKGVVLHTEDLSYSIYPGKDGGVITASTAAFSDTLQTHLLEIAKLVRPEQQSAAPTPAPAPQEPAQPAAPALIPQVPAGSTPASAPGSTS